MITHDQQLLRVKAPLERFLKECSGLRSKRGPLLIQFPPSFAFERRRVKRFLDTVRARYDGPLGLRTRHETWFSAIDSDLLVSYRVARVAADPPIGKLGVRARCLGQDRLLSATRLDAQILVSIFRGIY
jgi:uncharacterized protein YecE (DUF72 family)